MRIWQPVQVRALGPSGFGHVEDVFLSYSSQDRERETLRRLVTAFEQSGLSVFWDRKIPPGMTWRSMIQDRITQAKAIVVVWTKDSVESEWVHEEADHGRAREILFPVLLDRVVQPIGFGGVQAADLAHWSGDTADPALQSLVRALHERTRGSDAGRGAPGVEPGVRPASSASLSAHSASVEPAPPRRRSPWTTLALFGAGLGALGLGAAAVLWSQFDVDLSWLQTATDGPRQAATVVTPPVSAEASAAASVAPPVATVHPAAPLPTASSERAGAGAGRSVKEMLFEGLDRPGALRDFLLGTRGHWTGETQGGVYRLCNRFGPANLSQLFRISTFESKASADQPNAVITMSVQLTDELSKNAMAGILFRASADSVSVLARAPGRTFVVLQGEPGQLKSVATFQKSLPDSEVVKLRVDASGKLVRLFADGELLGSVPTDSASGGKLGFFARGTGCFHVSEFSVSVPVASP